jgi:hypothetical protein
MKWRKQDIWKTYHVRRKQEISTDISSKYLKVGCSFRKLGIILHYVVLSYDGHIETSKSNSLRGTM